jgi:hypothetical protein
VGILPLLLPGVKGKVVSAVVTAVAGGLLHAHTAQQPAQQSSGLFGWLAGTLGGLFK